MLVNSRQESERELAYIKSTKASESAKARYERSADALPTQSERTARAYESVSVSDSSSEGKKVQEENQISAAAERMYALHPKKKDLPLLPETLENSARVKPLAEIERVHALWCATEDWTKNNGRFAPSLPQWLIDRGYTQEPVSRAGPAKAPAADPSKIIPWDPYAKKKNKAGD
jgi:hypothetical protein